MEAALIQIVGTKATTACESCEKGIQPALFLTVRWQDPVFFPFVHGANEPWCPGARQTIFMMTDVVARAKSLGLPIMLAVSGWSDITTCPLMWNKIFGWFTDANIPVQARVYADGASLT